MAVPILQVEAVRKTYTQGRVWKTPTFSLEADFTIEKPGIIGIMGPNGSGKTTLFEIITGSNLPTAGRVLCLGQDIHRVKYNERDRLAIHYHQSYQVRHFRRTRPNFMLHPAPTDYPIIHLFDEPQFNTQDGYIGFMLEFFQRLRDEGRLVFVCLHPNERYHIEILREICERFFFVQQGRLVEAPDWETLTAKTDVRAYLGHLAEPAA